MQALDISDETIAAVAAKKRLELKQREKIYRGNRPDLNVKHSTVILVDDGLATGASMRAAVRALRTQRPKRLIVAVPVASPKTCAEFKPEVDEIFCAITPEPFLGVGVWYEQFPQTTDEEVQDLLARATEQLPTF
jgi:putative phosphoribosyl transferase